MKRTIAKVLSLVLALAMVAAVGVVAMAATDAKNVTVDNYATKNTKGTGEDWSTVDEWPATGNDALEQVVTVKATETEDSQVYYATVEFSDLDFQFDFKSSTWNPEQHYYTITRNQDDSAKDDTVKVTNHSSDDINVVVNFENGTAASNKTVSTANGFTATITKYPNAAANAALGTAATYDGKAVNLTKGENLTWDTADSVTFDVDVTVTNNTSGTYDTITDGFNLDTVVVTLASGKYTEPVQPEQGQD